MDDFDESYEPIRPIPSDPPPLPRMWKDPDGAESADAIPIHKKKRSGGDPAPARADRPKKKKKQEEEEVIDDGTGAIKLEETPVLDTYESRQRVRLLIGTVVTVIGITFLVLVLRAFKGSGTDESHNNDMASPPVTPELRASAEQEATLMLENAKKVDENGRTTIAVEMLTRLSKSYPGTAAARAALHAIARHKQDMPLFGEDAPVQFVGPKPPPGTSTATGPAPTKNGAEANANPPPIDGFGTATAPSASRTPSPNGPSTNIAPAAPVANFKPLPSGYRPKFEFPIHGSGWPSRIVSDRDGAELVLVPGATFLMGRDDGDPQEGPPHPVFVSTFYIDLHEVTVRQYLRFLKETGRPGDAAKMPQDDMPMVGITFKEATAFCTWAKRRLPTEAQWELAARGPDQGPISYWNGELPRKDPERGDRAMEPVMSLKSDMSYYGAFDMAANAWEWTSDFYDSKYYRKSRGLVSDPTGPATSLANVEVVSVRGGSKAGFLTWRLGRKTELKGPFLGFRGALPVEGAPVAPVVKPDANAGPNGNGLRGGVPPL